MSTLLEVVEAMAAHLEPLAGEIPGLQVLPYYNVNPTPPSIDIYPGEPFQNGAGFGDDRDVYFTVRARTTTADHAAASQQLLRLMDVQDPASVEEALTSDQTLGGVVDTIAVAADGVSGFREYLEDPQTNSRLIGCEWRMRVIT